MLTQRHYGNTRAFLRQVSVPTLPPQTPAYILRAMQAFIQSLLQHQRSRTPWSTASIEIKGDCLLAHVGNAPAHVKLSLPESLASSFKAFIKRFSKHKHFQKKVEDAQGSYLLRSNNNIFEISDIPSSLSDPKKLLTKEQRGKIKDMLDHRSGIMMLCAPTPGATLAALDGVGHVIKNIDKKQKVAVLLLNENSAIETLNNTVAAGPSFVLILAPMRFSSELWQHIEHAALAGTMIVLGMPSNTPIDTISHQQNIQAMLRGPLLKGLASVTPFVGGCSNCSRAIDQHPDVPAFLSAFDTAGNLAGLKGAHCPGCNECSYTGAGQPVPAVSLFQTDELDDLEELHESNIISDLLFKARQTPVPLRHATKMWRARPR